MMKAFLFVKNKFFLAFLCWALLPEMVLGQIMQKPEFKKPSPFLSYSTAHTTMIGKGVGIRSFSGGITWNESFTTAVSYDFLRSNVYRDFDEVPHRLNVAFVNFVSKYKVSLYNKMVLQAGLETGIGEAYFDGGNSQNKRQEHHFWQLTGIFDAYYKMLPWFGFGGEVGYRAVAFSPMNLSGVLLNIKLKLFPFELYQILRNNPGDVLKPAPLETD